MRGPTRVTRSRLGVFAGLVLLAAGVYLVFGLGWALIVAGAVVSAVFLLLYNVDEPPPQEVSR